MKDIEQTLRKLGSKPSISEEHGLELITDKYLSIFSPGISTGGLAEIRMALNNPTRKITTTTIDEEGLEISKENIKEMELETNIIAKYQDLTKEFPYEKNTFDFIYARLILHYLNYQQLDKTLENFYNSLKKSGLFFIVLRSAKNLKWKKNVSKPDPITKVVREPYYNDNKEVIGWGETYFHTVKTISEHLNKHNFKIKYVKEFQETLYADFMRTIPTKPNDLIEVLCIKE